MKQSYYPHFYAFLSMLLWGLSYVWTRITLDYYNPLSIIFLRLVLSSVVLFAFLAVTKKLVRIAKKDVYLFFLSALFNPFFYFLGENYGISLVSPTISSIIIATIPLLTPIAAIIAFRAKISSYNILGIFISFAGILLMILNRDLSLNASPRGVMFLFGAVLAAVFYTMTLKILSQTYRAIQIIAIQNLIGVIYFLPFFLIFDWSSFITVMPDAKVILTLIALALFASSMAFIFYAKAVKSLGMTKANVYTNLIPVFTGITSLIVLNEVFDSYKIAGGIIVIAGLLISQYKKKKVLVESIQKNK